MKSLYLLRHGKSSWDDPTLDDFDRPLAPRGERAAQLMGRYLGQQPARPEFILCSAARRTLETWQLVSASLEGRAEVRILRGLYHAPASALLAAIREAPDSARAVLLVGHNPAIQQLAAALTGPSSNPAHIEGLQRKFPTAALACLEFDSPHWSNTAEGSGRLELFLRAKELALADQAEPQNGSAFR